MSYVCPECGTLLNRKPTKKEIVENLIHIEGIEINELYKMLGHMMSITTIDIILVKLIQEHECYVPKKWFIASCYGGDGLRHIFPK